MLDSVALAGEEQPFLTRSNYGARLSESRSTPLGSAAKEKFPQLELTDISITSELENVPGSMDKDPPKLNISSSAPTKFDILKVQNGCTINGEIVTGVRNLATLSYAVYGVEPTPLKPLSSTVM